MNLGNLRVGVQAVQGVDVLAGRTENGRVIEAEAELQVLRIAGAGRRGWPELVNAAVLAASIDWKRDSGNSPRRPRRPSRPALPHHVERLRVATVAMCLSSAGDDLVDLVPERNGVSQRPVNVSGWVSHEPRAELFLALGKTGDDPSRPCP